jgi:hypothetical protein
MFKARYVIVCCDEMSSFSIGFGRERYFFGRTNSTQILKSPFVLPYSSTSLILLPQVEKLAFPSSLVVWRTHDDESNGISCIYH